MILRTFVLRFFKYLIRRRFILRRKPFFLNKYSFLKNEALKIKDFKKDLIRSFKRIIKTSFSFSISINKLTCFLRERIKSKYNIFLFNLIL